MSTIEHQLADLSRRHKLKERVVQLLTAMPEVTEVHEVGSLTSQGDRLSDIDFHVRVAGLSDRAFAEALPPRLGAIGSYLIEGWGLGRLPDDYVRTLYFDDQPLFWHIDVHCSSAEHVDGTDLLREYHGPQIFKMWIATVKHLLRGNTAEVDAFVQHIDRWSDTSALSGTPAARLGASLDLCAARAKDRGAPYGDVYARCAELHAEFLA